MPIFENGLDPAAELVVSEMFIISRAFYDHVASARGRFNNFWRHPELTPEQIAAAWGTKAKKIFEDHAALVQYVLFVDPTCLEMDYIQPPRAYEFEQVNGEYTGRVTIL